MKGVKVETDIFEGMKFGTSLSHKDIQGWYQAVVMSDPKSRTGEDDKKTLTELCYPPLSQDNLNWVSLFLLQNLR